jgi:hypothetical protein
MALLASTLVWISAYTPRPITAELHYGAADIAGARCGPTLGRDGRKPCAKELYLSQNRSEYVGGPRHLLTVQQRTGGSTAGLAACTLNTRSRRYGCWMASSSLDVSLPSFAAKVGFNQRSSVSSAIGGLGKGHSTLVLVLQHTAGSMAELGRGLMPGGGVGAALDRKFEVDQPVRMIHI